MGRRIQKVIQLEEGPRGRVQATTIYRKRGRKKRGSWGLNQVARFVRTVAQSQRDFANEYLSRHDKSHRDKADGWARELPYNVYRATRRGLKKLRSVSPLPIPGDL